MQELSVDSSQCWIDFIKTSKWKNKRFFISPTKPELINFVEKYTENHAYCSICRIHLYTTESDSKLDNSAHFSQHINSKTHEIALQIAPDVNGETFVFSQEENGWICQICNEKTQRQTEHDKRNICEKIQEHVLTKSHVDNAYIWNDQEMSDTVSLAFLPMLYNAMGDQFCKICEIPVDLSSGDHILSFSHLLSIGKLVKKTLGFHVSQLHDNGNLLKISTWGENGEIFTENEISKVEKDPQEEKHGFENSFDELKKRLKIEVTDKRDDSKLAQILQWSKEPPRLNFAENGENTFCMKNGSLDDVSSDEDVEEKLLRAIDILSSIRGKVKGAKKKTVPEMLKVEEEPSSTVVVDQSTPRAASTPILVRDSKKIQNEIAKTPKNNNTGTFLSRRFQRNITSQGSTPVPITLSTWLEAWMGCGLVVAKIIKPNKTVITDITQKSAIIDRFRLEFSHCLVDVINPYHGYCQACGIHLFSEPTEKNVYSFFSVHINSRTHMLQERNFDKFERMLVNIDETNSRGFCVVCKVDVTRDPVHDAFSLSALLDGHVKLPGHSQNRGMIQAGM